MLYARNGWLVSQAFDPVRRQLSGEAQPVAGPVEIYESLAWPSRRHRSNAWSIVGRAPRPCSCPGSRAMDARWRQVVARKSDWRASGLGDNGTRLIGHVDEGQTDLWLWDPARGTRDRLTATNEWESDRGAVA